MAEEESTLRYDVTAAWHCRRGGYHIEGTLSAEEEGTLSAALSAEEEGTLSAESAEEEGTLSAEEDTHHMHWGCAISRGGYTAHDIGITTTQTRAYEGQWKGWQGYEGRGMRGRAMFTGKGLIEIKIDIFCIFVFWPSRLHGILRLFGRVYELSDH